MLESPQLPQHLRRDIIKFSNSVEYRELMAHYGRKSFLETFAIHRSELQHSRFLAWLMDPSEFHGLGHLPFRKLLEMLSLVVSDTIFHRKSEGFLDHVLYESSDIKTEAVQVERTIGSKGRIDILIEATAVIKEKSRRLRVLIENKVRSEEHEFQTVLYKEWLDQTSKDGVIDILIYLTPLPSLQLVELSEPECTCKDAVQVNYQYLLDYVIEPLRDLTPSPEARSLIDQYIRCLSVPAIADDDTTALGDLIMAISEHERKLLKAFWQKHQSLILASFYAISSDPDQDEETRQTAETVLSHFGGKDYSTYTVLFDGSVVAKGLQKTNIGLVVAKTLIEKGLSDADFEALRLDRSSTYQLLMENKEIVETERKRYRVSSAEPIEREGRHYYASRNWGETNIPKFKSFLANNFPRIEIRKEVGSLVSS